MGKRALPQEQSEPALNRFKFVVAHELVHVFDMMRILVPALMDWKTFWSCALAEGQNCGKARDNFDDNAAVLDDYDGPGELAKAKAYWPTHADAWFKAMG